MTRCLNSYKQQCSDVAAFKWHSRIQHIHKRKRSLLPRTELQMGSYTKYAHTAHGLVRYFNGFGGNGLAPTVCFSYIQYPIATWYRNKLYYTIRQWYKCVLLKMHWFTIGAHDLMHANRDWLNALNKCDYWKKKKKNLNVEHWIYILYISIIYV